MKTPKLLQIALLLVLASTFAGCGECLRCDQEKDRRRTEMGEPSEKSTRVDGHIATETWIYWESDLSVVFLWDERDCSCDVSVYDFEEDAVLSDIHTLGSSFFRP